MNLTTAVVEERDFTKTLRTVGVVAADDTRTSHVHSKVRGWIEAVSVAYVGQKVRRGQALCAIYSQDVYASQLELIGLLERTPRTPLSGPFADAERRAQEQVIAAARRRLGLWDVSPAEIERLERTREPRRTFTLSAPRAGIVVAKQALAGMFIDPSVELYMLSDLSRVWVLVDVYEGDAPFVHVGDKAKLSFAGNPDKTLEALASFVAPVLDEATRTLKVRYELDNKDGTLRPGTFATAEMILPMGRSLAVPESAVIRTGERAIVFVVHGEGLEPREIKLGGLVGDMYRVAAGLSTGDRVATGAQFLLDSESRLRATSMPGGGHAGH
jgi:Cu(I)/Ag(I) efflux system membrane fusion protein